MKRLISLLGCLLFSNLSAEIVVWTASGQVTSLTGVFEGQEITIDDEVTFEMSYNDGSPEERFNSIPTFGSSDSDYRDDIRLNLEVRIGSRTWSGEVINGSEPSPRSLLVKRRRFSGSEVLEASLTIQDGAVFQSFPLDVDEEDDSMVVTFSGGFDFIGEGIDPDSFDSAEVTTAQGSIRSGSGANQLSFSLDPASLVIIDEEEILVVPPISLAVTEEEFELSFVSSPFFNYSIETSNMLTDTSWNETAEGAIGGTGAPIFRSFQRENTQQFYRVLVSPKE